MGIGEALDRLSILSIKRLKLGDEVAVMLQFQNLALALWDVIGENPLFAFKFFELFRHNFQQWRIEDEIRQCADDVCFAKLAREIHAMNRYRMRLRAEIDKRYNSSVREHKQYAGEDDGQTSETPATPTKNKEG